MITHLPTQILDRLDSAIEENKETGRFRCRRDIFTDGELFELEMRRIWEGNWIYLAHESQASHMNKQRTAFASTPLRLMARKRHLGAFPAIPTKQASRRRSGTRRSSIRRSNPVS